LVIQQVQNADASFAFRFWAFTKSLGPDVLGLFFLLNIELVICGSPLRILQNVVGTVYQNKLALVGCLRIVRMVAHGQDPVCAMNGLRLCFCADLQHSIIVDETPGWSGAHIVIYRYSDIFHEWLTPVHTLFG